VEKEMIKEMRNSKNPIVSLVYNYTRQSMTGEWDKNGEWKYIPMKEYAEMVSEWIKELPKDFDIVCAIPRSGLIAGSMIATTLGKPLTTPYQLVQGNVWGLHNTQVGKTNYGKETTVLLVDDSIGSGNSMAESATRIKNRFPNIKIIWAALVVRNESRDKIDRCHCQHSDNMRLSFEFNLSRLATSYGKIACDMDGVICRDYIDPLPEEKYIDWIINVDPYIIPKGSIDSIITNRDEKYRGITEEWLRNHNVEYKNLIMNGKAENTLNFKIDSLLKIKPDWYWESDPLLSAGIFRATGIPTLCINTGQLFS
jgi:orotate phosphoribosyltransferase-like protein